MAGDNTALAKPWDIHVHCRHGTEQLYALCTCTRAMHGDVRRRCSETAKPPAR
jgi:hypothetical protein